MITGTVELTLEQASIIYDSCDDNQLKTQLIKIFPRLGINSDCYYNTMVRLSINPIETSIKTINYQNVFNKLTINEQHDKGI